MSASRDILATTQSLGLRETLWPISQGQRLSFRWSDIWKAPLHDFPLRDEIVYQYLPLSAGMSVLEIGPGSGITAFRLARRVRKLTLLDLAANNIAQLRETLRKVPNLDFICADVCQPGLTDSVRTQFDAIFGLAVLDLVPDPQTCLRNLCALLQPGGQLLLQFPNYPPPKGSGVTYFRTKEELDQLLDAAGFENWAVYALKLRPYAALLFRQFHERPLRLYRRIRDGKRDGRQQSYDATWAFRYRKTLEPYKYLVHGTWMAFSAALRLGGDCFDYDILGDEIGHRNVLLLARHKRLFTHLGEKQ